MSSEELRTMLAERARDSSPEHRAAMDDRIRTRFGTTKAVLISDMSGFSVLTQREGIIHFLGLIHRMQELCVPQIEAHRGSVVKREADNLFAVFDDAASAVQAARAMRRACQEDAEGRPDVDRVGIAVGIGYGEILDLDGEDFFGNEVNLASKLGEDIATGGDVLLTAAALEAAGSLEGVRAESREETISKVHLQYYALHEG